VAVPALISGLAGMVSDVFNNGTGVYEMGMASNAIEKILTDWLAHQIGYDASGSGFLTSGGTLANLTAMLAARKTQTDVWEKGSDKKIAVMVSEQAHYCIDRAARILGMGNEGIILIPTDDQFKMKTELLESYLEQAKQNDIQVIAVIGSACTTSTGSYDDLEAIADFCQKHQIWFHADGAHGGAVVVSEKYRHLAKGIERADSITIDFHKMMMTPTVNTALMFKNGALSYQTFQQKAEYLWEVSQSEEWFNSGKRTFECTKLMLGAKVYAIIKAHGKAIFEENVNHLYDKARVFAAIIEQHPAFELAIPPEANIINFRYTAAEENHLDAINHQIRQQLIENGDFFIVQTVIRNQRYLRSSVMNPLTTVEDFKALLSEIERIGKALCVKN
jgi:L-2,4-diaminobutyrate decarboxylase